MYTIIGGGIGGLTTALALKKVNLPVQVFEQATAINEVGAGIWLAPNALQVLDWLGLLGKIKQAGHRIDRIQLAKADFSVLSDNDQTWARKVFGCSTIAIHRAKLQQTLLEALPVGDIHLGKSLDHFTQEDGVIHLSFEDGMTLKSDCLIGADGIHSKVRVQLFPSSSLRYTGQTCWRGIADMELEKEMTHLAAELWGKQRRFGFSQIGPNKVYWFAVRNSPANQTEPQGIRQQKLLEVFAAFHPLVQALIRHTPNQEIIRNDLWDLHPIKQWHKGRICLVGDAAHATTPNMGQGAGQAIEDAYFLAQQLNQYPNAIRAFESFQQLRYKKVQMVVGQSWKIGQVAHWRYGRGLRNAFMRMMPASLAKKQMIALYQL